MARAVRILSSEKRCYQERYNEGDATLMTVELVTQMVSRSLLTFN